MKPYVEPLKAALGDLQKATMWLMQNALAKPDNGAGVSYDYMHLFGRVALGYIWARIARAALDKKKESASDGAWLDAKLTTGKILHGEDAARDGLSPRAHHGRARDDDEPAGGDVLMKRIANRE